MLSRLRVMDMMLAYSAVALVFTSLRLAVRRVRNWGKDDFLAVLATLALIAQSILMNLKVRGVPFANAGPKVAANVYYVNNALFYTEDWAARLSILFSVLRICPSPRIATFLKVMAVLFFLTWVTLVSLLIGHCKKTEYTWSRKQPSATCQLHKAMIYLQFAVGILSDLILIGVPIYIFTLMPSLKRLALRLQIIFSSTLLLTVATVAQTAVTLSGAGRAGTAGLIAATTETFVAIMVCNATAVVLACICLFRRGEDTAPLREATVGDALEEKRSRDTESVNSGGLNKNAPHSVGGRTERHSMSLKERWTTMDIDAN